METHKKPTSRQKCGTTAVHKDKQLFWFNLGGVRWPRISLRWFETIFIFIFKVCTRIQPEVMARPR